MVLSISKILYSYLEKEWRSLLISFFFFSYVRIQNCEYENTHLLHFSFSNIKALGKYPLDSSHTGLLFLSQTFQSFLGLQQLHFGESEMLLCMLNRFRSSWLFVTLWTVAHQAPPSMGFSRQEYWSGLPCTPPGDLPLSKNWTRFSYVFCIGRGVLYH